jgi:endonuclease/exonuclease/phosphatase family metal-dependent hydrolase
MARRRRSAAVAVAVLACAAAYLTPMGTAAASGYPAPPTGVHLVSVASTSITVSADRAANVTRYKVFVSTVKNDLYVDSLATSRSTRSVASSTHPEVTVSGLKYAAVPYYYRYATTNYPHMRVSTIRTISLRPAVPGSVQAVSGSKGVYLTWSSVPATGFSVAQATNPAMTTDRRDFTLRGGTHQFTPYGLTNAMTYYFRVRALNGTTKSAYSTQVSADAAMSQQPVRVMTYNVLALGADGTAPRGEVISPWNTARRPAAASLVERGNPDVLAVEEGADWTHGYLSPRQVDSLRSTLGSTYSLAPTEIPPGQPGYFWVGNYIIYRNTTYTTVGSGGNFSIGDGLHAVWQVLKNRATGATFLMVAAHLRAGKGDSYDRLRLTQTQNVLNGARDIAARKGNVPIVYAGDFNSYLSSYHPFDAPSRIMLAAHVNEAYYVAQSRTNARYNSCNLYQRIPPQGLGSIDRIFGEPGVAMRSWYELLDVTDGHFAGVIPSDHNPVMADLSVSY